MNRLFLIAVLLGMTSSAESDDAGSQRDPQSPIVIEDVQAILIKDVQVPVTVSGQIAEFLIREGQQVKKGQPLARLDISLAQRAQALSQHELRIAELESESRSRLKLALQRNELADGRLQRLNRLREQSTSVISLDELQEAVLRQKEAHADFELAQEEQKIADLHRLIKDETLAVNTERLSRHTITAPFDGVVVERIEQQGQWVPEGGPIVRLIDLSRLRLEAFVDGKLFDGSLTGSEVRFTAGIPSRNQPVRFSGRIVFTSPIVQPVNGQIRVWAEIENPDYALRPGVLGTLTVQPQDIK